MRRIKVSHRSQKPKKDAKTIPVWGSDERGDGEDHGKWFRCWNCDFLCNSDRDALGGPEDRNSITYELYTLQDETGTDHSTAPFQDGLTERYRLVGGTGCPFCHTLNWRGDY